MGGDAASDDPLFTGEAIMVTDCGEMTTPTNQNE